jgi:hypothetical protein
LELHFRAWLVAAVAAASAAAAPVHAERDKYSGAPLPPDKNRPVPSPITDHFYVEGAFFAPKVATTLRVDNSAGFFGSIVSAENDLGLKSKENQGRIELMFRMRARSKLRVTYYELDRSAQKALSRTIQFGDQTFVVNDVASSSLDWKMFALTYTYELLHFDRFEAGLGLGVYLMQGEAQGEVLSRQQRQEISGVAPYPTAAVDAAWRISRRFALTARAQYLDATVNNFTGSFGDYHVDLQYRWTPNFTLGAGYSRFALAMGISGGSFPGLLNLNVRGPEAFFRFSF